MEKTKLDQTIIDLALKGKSNAEISYKLNLDENSLNKYIESLKNPNHPNYDLDTYYKIQMERNLAQRNIVDKDFLEEIVKLIQNGFTILEIACMKEKNETEIRNYVSYLKSHYIYKDIELYQNVIKQEEKNEMDEKSLFYRLQMMESEGVVLEKYSASKLLKRYQKIKKIHQMILYFLKKDMNVTVNTLANQFDLSIDNVTNILLGKEEKDIVLLIISNDMYERMIEKRKKESVENIKKYNRKEKDSRTNDEELLNIRKLMPQMFFWTKFILAFKITLKDFGKLTNVKDLELLKKNTLQVSNTYGSHYYKALIYLWECYEVYYQKEMDMNFQKAKKYLFLLNLAKKQNKEEYQEMIKKINDQEASAIIKSRKNWKELTEEEKHIIIDFYLKYALTSYDIPYDLSAILNSCNEVEYQKMDLLIAYNEKNKKIKRG